MKDELTKEMTKEMLDLAKKVVPGNEDKVASIIAAVKIMAVECGLCIDNMRVWFEHFHDLFATAETFVKQCLVPKSLRRHLRDEMQFNWVKTFDGNDLERYLLWLCHSGMSGIFDAVGPTDVFYHMMAYIPLSSVETVLAIVAAKELEYALNRSQIIDDDLEDDLEDGEDDYNLWADEEMVEPTEPRSRAREDAIQTLVDFVSPHTSDFITEFQSFFRGLSEHDHEVIKDHIDDKLYCSALLYATPKDRQKVLEGFDSDGIDRCYAALQALSKNAKDEEILCDFLRCYNRMRRL